MIKSVVIVLTAFFLSVTSVLASGFVLNNIGALNTGGYQYSEWWYQGENPTLSGITTPNAVVTIDVDGSSQTVTADASGNWTAATTMASGDHTVTLTSVGSTIAMTLHLNQTLPADIGAPAESTQPVAGISSPTLLFIFGGLLLAALGLYTRRFAPHRS